MGLTEEGMTKSPLHIQSPLTSLFFLFMFFLSITKGLSMGDVVPDRLTMGKNNDESLECQVSLGGNKT